MLSNRTTRIKLVENEFNAFKKMVGLAIRLSPQDPNYEVNSIVLHNKINGSITKSQDITLDCNKQDNENDKIKLFNKSSSSNSTNSLNENIVITVNVTTPTIENQIILAPTPSPRGNRNVRDLFDQENIFLSENKRQESPARKYISPMKSRSNSLASSINKSSIGSTNKPLNYREILPLLSSKKTKSNDSKTNVDFTNTVEANNSEEAIAENSTFTSMVEEDVEQKDLSNETNQNEIEIDDEITESIEEIQINRTIDDSNYDFIDNSNYYEEKESCHNRYNEFDYDDEDIQATWKNSNEEIYMHSPIPAKTFIPFQCLNNTNTKEIETDDLNEDILDEDDFHTPRTSPIRNPFIESNNEIVTDTTINKQLDDRIGDLLDESINEESQDIENEDNNIDKVDEKIINNDNLEYNNITTNLSNKTPVKSKRGSIATPNRFKTPTKITKAIANTPIYPNGMTAGENAKYYDNNMRNYSNNNRKQSSTRKQSILSPHSNKLPITLDELSPVFQKSTISKEGRPSTGTIEKQWEFMKAYFVNNIDDELEWLMISKRPGAYQINLYDSTISLIKPVYDNTINSLNRMINIDKTNESTDKTNIINQLNDLKKQFITVYNNLTTILSTNSVNFLNDKTIKSISYIVTTTLTNDIKLSKYQIKLKECLNYLSLDYKQFSNTINEYNNTIDKLQTDIEKWNKREKDTLDYLAISKQEENEWFTKELVMNNQSLSLIRSYYYLDISECNINDINKVIKQNDGLYTLELINELKNNKLLQWVITHSSDIALANFLTGDKKQYFENYESLDINEMRAIAVCLPDKFELDNDGKKAEWRARFMTRVKQLVGQFNGDLVKGGWDRKHNRRSMVKLPPLKPEQLRRPIYYYRTKEQCDSRLKQYDDKQALLDKKTVWLSNARITVDEAKREYDVILNEMRDPELKAAYGVEQFAMAKDLAKQEFIEADKKRKNLEKEVIQLKATIASSPMSREQFYASMVELDKFLAERDIDWNQSNLPPVLIEGIFDPFPEIKRVERCNAKFLSAEEEAEIRKLELLSLKSKQTNNSTEEITNTVVETLESVDNTNDNKELHNHKPNQLSKIYPKPVENDSNTLLSPSIVRKRNSVLDTANPDMINILNNIFSPGKSQLVIRRGASMLSPGSIHRQTMSGNITTSLTNISNSNANNDIINEEKKEIKTTQSKLLQRLLGKSSKSTNAEDTPSANKPNLSFLDQIKKKMNNDNSNEPIDKPKLSFLDQIKKRMNNTIDNDSGNSDEHIDIPKMSFLDQIKKRKNQLEVENLSSESCSKPKMSFLDQIKARSKVNDDKENLTNNM